MNKLILCEGATDAILLSYYLEKTAGWTFCRKPPKDLQIKEDGIEESINWYEKNDDRLLIMMSDSLSIYDQALYF